MATLAGLYRRYPEWTGNWFGPNPLAGEFPRKTRDWDSAGMAAVFDGLAYALGDADALVRRQAIAGLIGVGDRALPQLRRHARGRVRSSQPGDPDPGDGCIRVTVARSVSWRECLATPAGQMKSARPPSRHWRSSISRHRFAVPLDCSFRTRMRPSHWSRVRSRD